MKPLIFDNSPLSHFARANELEALAAITAQRERFVTQAVLDELEVGVAAYRELAAVAQSEWLQVATVESLPELQAFAEYARRLGSGVRDIGEAATLAWAEVHRGVAILDERAGTRHARERGVDAHGTLWLIAEGYRSHVLTAKQSEQLVDALNAAEAWFPCSGADFLAWAAGAGLL